MATSEPSALAAALGRVPSGLFVVTARHDGQETGMLASWVMQCGFSPPQVTVAVKKERPVADWLTRTGAPVVVNVIPEDGKKLLAHFGKGFAPGEPAFEGLDVDRGAAGAPVLNGALAYLDCRVSGWADAADHLVFVLEVTGGRVLSDGRPAVHVRKNGLNY